MKREKEEEESSSSSEETKYQIYTTKNRSRYFAPIRNFLVERGGWSQSERYQSANLIFTSHTNIGKKRGMKAGGMNFAVLESWR